MQVLKRGSEFCGGCADDMYGDKCHCLCHKQALFSGFHEIAWSEGEAQPVVNPEG